MARQETLCLLHHSKLTSYCNVCGEFVCNLCKQSRFGKHEGHQYMSATEKTNELKEEISEYHNNVTDICLNPLREIIHEHYLVKSRLEGNCDELTREVEKRKESFIKEIIRTSQKLKNSINGHRLEFSPGLASRIANLEDKKREIDFLMKTCENVTNTGNIYEILEFNTAKKPLSELHTTHSSPRQIPTLELHTPRPGSLVGDYFGNIRKSRTIFKEEIRVLKSWSYDIYIEHLFTRNDCVWISKTGFFVSVKPKTGEEVERKLCSLHPSGFIVSTSGEVIYSVSNEHCIYKITPALTVRLKHTYPYSPCGLCLASNGGFYVSMHQHGTSGKIVHYFNEECADWLEIICYRKGVPLLKKPIKIIENGNRDLCVIDAASESVIGMNSMGIFKFEYTGSRTNFEPIGICSDSRYNVLVSDFGHKMIDVLLQDGRFLTSIKLQPLGISRPMGLCVTKDGHLCVGQGNGCVHVLRY
ncbi:uncharacterized protein LOC134245293 [Saccostrea cucullata]|uniref:uncharacterized protein LOC134245293 n=1 Tax=Saccostrea cuccullata TaxID=36930 RepID=UPI002ED630BC